MWVRTSTFLVWAAVAGVGVFWGARLLADPLPVPPHAVLAAPAATGGLAVADLGRLLGAEPPPVTAAGPAAPPEAARYQLLGVVAPKLGRATGVSREGVALIAIDGKLPRTYRVGAAVGDTLVLQQVRARSVALGPPGAPATLTLELPPLPPPAAGVPGAPTAARSPAAPTPAPTGRSAVVQTPTQITLRPPVVPLAPMVAPMPTEQPANPGESSGSAGIQSQEES